MRRLLQTTFFSMGLLLIVTTALLHTVRDGEGVLSLIAVQGQESPRLVLLHPFSHHIIPLTPKFEAIGLVDWTSNGLLFSTLNRQGDTALYRVPHIGAKPESLSDQRTLQMVVSENGEWIVVGDFGGLGGQYELRAIRTDGSEQHPLTLNLQPDLQLDSDIPPVVSPDGIWVAFAVYLGGEEEFDVYRVRSDGTGLENLTAETDDWRVELVEWTKDGLFVRLRERLFRITDSGSIGIAVGDSSSDFTEHRIKPIEGTDLQLVVRVSEHVPSLYGIRPNGTAAWVRSANCNPCKFSTRWALGQQDGQWVRIRTTDGAMFSVNPSFGYMENQTVEWSLDGQSLLLTTNPVAGWDELWRYDVDTDQLTLLWQVQGSIAAWDWSPDGQYAVVTIYHSNNPAPNTLHWIDTHTGEHLWEWDARFFVEFGPAYEKTWSAGVLLLIGVACVAGAWIRWPRLF